MRSAKVLRGVRQGQCESGRLWLAMSGGGVNGGVGNLQAATTRDKMALPGNDPQRRLDPAFNYSELTFWEKVNIISPVPPKIVLLLLLTGVLLLAAYYFSLFAIHGFSADFLKINRCLESGGRWNAAERRCEQVQDVYIPPDPAMQPY